MKKIINTSMIYMILALAAGVFYREFTKSTNFTGNTTLSVGHTHFLVLGMFFFLIVALFCKVVPELLEEKMFSRFYILYNISLPFMGGMLIVRGVLQVLAVELSTKINAMISGFSGIAHILITIALVMFFLALKKVFTNSNK